MDLNLVVICGALAVDPEIREFDSGAKLARLLVSVKSESPRRVDVLPVAIWDPTDETLSTLETLSAGSRVWITGSLQRRFTETGGGARSRVEIVAVELSRVHKEEMSE